MSGDDVHPLVRRILSSPGGRRLLELTDAEMGRFLTSAESVLLLREEEGDDSIRETIKRLREGRSATTRSVNLVYEGAGVHGIALIGALSALEERGFAVERAAGASAGALIAVLSAAGYSADEMRQVYLDVDFRHFQDRGWQDRVPLIGRTLSVVMDQGIFEGRMLLEWVSELLATRGVSTFGDLRVAAADGVPSYAAEVLVSDLTAGRSLVLPREAARLGLEPDALDVALAVRASMSLPVFFQPVRVRNPATQDDHILVDGAVLSRFPVSLFDDRDSPSTSPTLGILVDDKQDEDEEPSSPDEPPVHGGPLTLKYLRRLVAARAERPPLSGPDSARTIIVPSLGLRATNFDAAAEQLHALYHGGRDAARMFLDRSEPVDGDSPPL